MRAGEDNKTAPFETGMTHVSGSLDAAFWRSSFVTPMEPWSAAATGKLKLDSACGELFLMPSCFLTLATSCRGALFELSLLTWFAWVCVGSIKCKQPWFRCRFGSLPQCVRWLPQNTTWRWLIVFQHFDDRCGWISPDRINAAATMLASRIKNSFLSKA